MILILGETWINPDDNRFFAFLHLVVFLLFPVVYTRIHFNSPFLVSTLEIYNLQISNLYK